MQKDNKIKLPDLEEEVQDSGDGANIGGAPCAAAILASYIYSSK